MDKLGPKLNEINTRLLEIKQELARIPELELGDDPGILGQFVTSTEEVIALIMGIESFYKKPWEKYNAFLTARRLATGAQAFLQQVQERGYGSGAHTAQFKKQIQLVQSAINDLAKSAEITLFPYENHLKNLGSYLEKLKAKHPARRHLAILSTKLKKSWERGDKQDNLRPILAQLEELSLSLGGPRFEELITVKPVHNAGTLFVPPFERPLPVENYWAIIIGVGTYEHSAVFGELPYASNDAHQLAELLLSCKRYDPSRMLLLSSTPPSSPPLKDIYYGIPKWSNVRDTIKSVAAKTGEEDMFLFYFSGHGDVHDGKSYLILQDTHPDWMDQSAILMQAIHTLIQESEAKVKAIILDTCQSGAILSGKSSKRMQKAFVDKVLEAAEGTVVLTSCKEGELSFEYDRAEVRTSAFTYFLMQTLQKGGMHKNLVTAHDLHIETVYAVQNWSEKRKSPQTPQYRFTGQGDPILFER